MSPHTRLLRNMAWMTIAVAIATLVYGAALCYVKQAALPTATLIILALVVAIGLLPGCYLRSLVDRGAWIVNKTKPKLLPFGVAAIVFPALVMAWAGFFAYAEWDYLGFAAEFGLETTAARIALVLMIVTGGIGAFFLVVNAITLVRVARTRKQEPN